VTDISRVNDILRTVTRLRSKGDAAAKQGNSQRAEQAWTDALAKSEEGFGALAITPELDLAQARSLDKEVAVQAAELMGVRGGLLHRLGRTRDALASYRTGAILETGHDLPQTYNRVNAIKRDLIAGDNTLADLHGELVAARDTLDERLSTDETATDDAWLWADLGDLCLLLGDDEAAIRAYRDLVARGRSDSPVSTLSVLREIIAALEEHGDPDAGRAAASLRHVEETLSGSRAS